MLLFFRHRSAIIFPTFIGLFLFTCNAHRDIIALLGRVGLSVAYSSILATLHLLASDAGDRLRLYGAVMKLGEPMFLLLFDNVNKMQRAWQQTVGHEDEVKSGCAATLVGLEDVRPGAMNAKPFLENLQKKLRKDLTVSQLYNDINWDHIKGVGGATAMRVWTTHVPALAKFAPAVDTLFTETYSRHPLRLRKSDIHPMRTTDIDEAPTAGVAAELANLVLDQLQSFLFGCKVGSSWYAEISSALIAYENSSNT